ncbi:MAG: A24 family peptidase [Motiliproteus sp.]
MIAYQAVPTALIFFLLLLVVMAALIDLAQCRIPNTLVIWGLLLAFAVRYHYLGISGLLQGLGGMCVGFFVFLPLYIMGGLGAGDVKLMATIGSFLDPIQALMAVVFSINAATILGVGYLLLKGGGRAYLGRYTQMVKALSVTGRWIYIPPAPGEAAAHRFPLAGAIAIGTVIVVYYYYPGFFSIISDGRAL